jgi:E3 ubiquitin-protein ligase RFWD2
LWKVDSPLSSQEERVYRGHINEKNFVGLAVSNDFIACGSENHEVCMYYKPLSKPITRIALPYTGAELREKPFISAVAWHPGRKELLAATSQGSAFVLSLEGDDADAIPPI